MQFGAVMAYSGRVGKILSVWVLFLIFISLFFLGGGGGLNTEMCKCSVFFVGAFFFQLFIIFKPRAA